MKVVLKYDPENYDDLEKARTILDSQKNKVIVEELYTKLIRPYHKHGFSCKRVNKILEELGEDGQYLMDYFGKLVTELVEGE